MQVDVPGAAGGQVWWWLPERRERVGWVVDGDDDAVVRLASEFDDNSRSLAMTHGEGCPARLTERADQDDTRKSGARHPQTVNLLHPVGHFTHARDRRVWDRQVAVNRLDLLRWRQRDRYDISWISTLAITHYHRRLAFITQSGTSTAKESGNTPVEYPCIRAARMLCHMGHGEFRRSSQRWAFLGH